MCSVIFVGTLKIFLFESAVLNDFDPVRGRHLDEDITVIVEVSVLFIGLWPYKFGEGVGDI